MAIISDISSSIKKPAGIIQFAKDGKYEESWIISLNENRPAKNKIKDYLNKDSYQKLIVEYIWGNNIDEERYVLTVIQDDACLEKNKYQFVKKCLDILYDRLSFENLINQIDQQIIGKGFLLKQLVQKVRLGIFNHWFSVGPIEIWNGGDNLNLNLIKEKIKSRPEIERS